MQTLKPAASASQEDMVFFDLFSKISEKAKVAINVERVEPTVSKPSINVDLVNIDSSSILFEEKQQCIKKAVELETPKPSVSLGSSLNFDN